MVQGFKLYEALIHKQDLQDQLVSLVFGYVMEFTHK